jgi:hypothetical protein
MLYCALLVLSVCGVSVRVCVRVCAFLYGKRRRRWWWCGGGGGGGRWPKCSAHPAVLCVAPPPVLEVDGTAVESLEYSLALGAAGRPGARARIGRPRMPSDGSTGGGAGPSGRHGHTPLLSAPEDDAAPSPSPTRATERFHGLTPGLMDTELGPGDATPRNDLPRVCASPALSSAAGGMVRVALAWKALIGWNGRAEVFLFGWKCGFSRFG